MTNAAKWVLLKDNVPAISQQNIIERIAMSLDKL